MRLEICAALFMVFSCCFLSGVFLEHLVKYSSGCGQLVSFSQFAFISFYGFIFVANCGTKKSHVPLKHYATAVFLFFLTTLSGHMALGFSISVPLQMIIKSGSMLATLSLGVIILKRTYPMYKYIAVIMSSVGIATCLVMNAKNKTSTGQAQDSFPSWIFGIILMLISLFAGALLGITQERISVTYGKHPEEMLFYTHCLGLPAFALFGRDIFDQVSIFSLADRLQIPYIGVGVPYPWLLLLGNVVTQFLCIKSVYFLWTEMSALAVNVLLTFRKIISLMFSILYFQYPFTIYHWIGSFLVFSGTLLYSGACHHIFEWRIKELGKLKK